MFGGGDGFADRDFVKLDAESLGEIGGVTAAVFTGNGRRERNTDDVFRTHRLRGKGADHGGVDPTAEPQENALESAFAGIIAEAEDERLMDGGHANGVIVRGDGRGFSQRKIDDGVFGLEGGKSCKNAALGMMDDAAAVKNEFVVAADRVAINDGAVAAFGGSADEGFALTGLAALPRTGGKIEEVIQVCSGEFLERISRITRFGGLVGLSPDVFANGESDLEPFPLVDARCGGGFKVTGFVKDVVGRQEAFAPDGLDGAVFAPRGGVVGDAVLIDHGTGNEGDRAGFGSKRMESVFGIANESGFEEEVAGWVAAGRQFRSEDQVGARIDQFIIRLK